MSHCHTAAHSVSDGITSMVCVGLCYDSSFGEASSSNAQCSGSSWLVLILYRVMERVAVLLMRNCMMHGPCSLKLLPTVPLHHPTVTVGSTQPVLFTVLLLCGHLFACRHVCWVLWHCRRGTCIVNMLHVIALPPETLLRSYTEQSL
jgi:hypothetical protein